MDFALISLGTVLALSALGLYAVGIIKKHLTEITLQCLASVERITQHTIETLKATSVQDKARADIMRSQAMGEITKLQDELRKSADVIQSSPEAQSLAEQRALEEGMPVGSLVVTDKTGQKRRLMPL